MASVNKTFVIKLNCIFHIDNDESLKYNIFLNKIY